MLQASTKQASAPISAVSLLPKFPNYADHRQMVAACYPDVHPAEAERLARALDRIGQAYGGLRHHRQTDDSHWDGFYRSGNTARPSLQPPHAQPKDALHNWRKAFQQLFSVLNVLPSPSDPAFNGLIDGQRMTWKILCGHKPGKR